MPSKRSNEQDTQDRLRQIEEKLRKLQESQAHRPGEDASGGTAQAVLRGLGDLVPGLGGLIGNVAKSPAFLERLKQIDAELDRRLRETPLERVEPEVTAGISRRPMGIPPNARGRGSSTTSEPAARARPKRPDQRLATEAPEEISADVFDEGHSIVVIAELPGVAEDDLEVKAQGRTLSIVVNAKGAGAAGRRSRDVELPANVRGEPQCSFNKGILKVQIEKAGRDD